MVLGISLFHFLSELGYVVPSHSFENMEASLIRGFRRLPEAKISKLTGIQYEGYKLLIASEPCNCRISLGMVPNRSVVGDWVVCGRHRLLSVDVGLFLV